MTTEARCSRRLRDFRINLASSFPLAFFCRSARKCLLRPPDDKLEASASGPFISAALRAQVKRPNDTSLQILGRPKSRHGRTRRALMRLQCEAVAPTVERHRQPIHRRYEKHLTPTKTAGVEWWHVSSRVPCCMHRIALAVRQRPTAPGQL